MVNVPASEIYPEASQGRLKTTDDKSGSIHEEKRIISKNVEDDFTRLRDTTTREFNYSDKLFSILKILLPLLFPLGFLSLFLKTLFPPISILFYGTIAVIIGLVVISLVLSATAESERRRYKKKKAESESKDNEK